MASADEYAAWIVKNADKMGSPEFDTVAAAYQEAKNDRVSDLKATGATGAVGATQLGNEVPGLMSPEMIAGNPGVRATLNAADLPLGAMQFIDNLANRAAGALPGAKPRQPAVMNELLQQLEGVRNAGNKLYDQSGPGTSLVGHSAAVGGALLTPGLVKGGSMIPSTEQGVTKALLKGGAGGGVVGAATPVVSGDEGYVGKKANQIGSGVAAGAATPAAIGAGRSLGTGVGHMLDLVLPSGPQRIHDRYIKKIVGEQNRPELINALERAQEIVPGSKPTVAEAVAHLPSGSPLIAHQEITSKIPQGISAQFGERNAAQQQARAKIITPIAKDKPSLQDAEDLRTVHANANYELAFKQPVAIDKELVLLSKNPYYKGAVRDATKEMEARNLRPETNLTQYLHYIKLSLDGELRKTGNQALDKTQKESVTSLQDKLTAWMGKNNPSYEFARSEFEKHSIPIERMKIGQALQGKLRSSGTGNETPGQYRKAVTDEAATVRRATGFPGEREYGDVMTPKQNRDIHAVASDLERTVASKHPVQRTALQGGVDVAEETRTHFPQMLDRKVMLANAILRRLAGSEGVGPKVERISAETLLKPDLMAKSLQDKKSAILKAIVASGRGGQLLPADVAARQEQ